MRKFPGVVSRKESRYSESDAAGVVRQMLSVVALCHLNGVVHRDLKPEVAGVGGEAGDGV